MRLRTCTLCFLLFFFAWKFPWNRRNCYFQGFLFYFFVFMVSLYLYNNISHPFFNYKYLSLYRYQKLKFLYLVACKNRGSKLWKYGAIGLLHFLHVLRGWNIISLFDAPLYVYIYRGRDSHIILHIHNMVST